MQTFAQTERQGDGIVSDKSLYSPGRLLHRNPPRTVERGTRSQNLVRSQNLHTVIIIKYKTTIICRFQN
jgi:hypothetical protein